MLSDTWSLTSACLIVVSHIDTPEPRSAIAEIAVGNKARALRVALSADVLACCELMSNPCDTGCVTSFLQNYRERHGYETAVMIYSRRTILPLIARRAGCAQLPIIRMGDVLT